MSQAIVSKAHKIGTVNVNSLISKLQYVTDLLIDENLSFIARYETWYAFFISEYSWICVFRKNTEGSVHKHGVGLYVKKSLEAVRETVKPPNVLVANIVKWNLFVIAYRSPSNTPNDNEGLRQFIVDFCLGKEVV